MAKHLNVNLQFTADTSQAASQIKNLQSLLAELTNGSAIGKDLPITKELMEAQQAAGRLKAVLQDSLNPKGTVDIGKFTQNFNKAGLDIRKIKSQMESLGPTGSKAFAQLAQSVATADAPLRRTSKLVSELSTTLKNTARWQLTSSMIHGFMGGLQEAYHYAQSLDKSLTNIRIVSGSSADEMARFAEQANKSAQALSTTTTKYADAALIYYQQGLNDQEVKERTDTTIKMANVTGEQVQDVSSYMTAIWNNFNKDGDQAVEHFGDVMTKLGAATAASTDEIAAGLSKFSAVADTIGLSFDMASSSVTAIVDQTREAPEVVGTALKTIFSRVEGLKQGETLEDGVDLNKYSQGLKTVGVDIMDASGQLKDMDTILFEIGDKWETLDKNSQVALAQTVAGVRQYNQFIALFDNWDKVQENLQMASDATGELTKQNEIYEESWEAARNRVTAAAQAIYSDLLDDDAFKGMLNTLALVLEGVDSLIDSMGGLSGVIGTLGVVFTRVFEKQMIAGISTMAYNLKQMTKSGKAENEQTRTNWTEAWKDTGALGDTKEGQTQKKAVEQQATLQQQLYQASKNLDDATIKQLQTEMSINQVLNERLVLKAKEFDASKELENKVGQELYSQYSSTADNIDDRKAVRDMYIKADQEASFRKDTAAGVVDQIDFDEVEFIQQGQLKDFADNLDADKFFDLKNAIGEMLKTGMSVEDIIKSQEYLNAAIEDTAHAYDDVNKATGTSAEKSREKARVSVIAATKEKELAQATDEVAKKNIEVQKAIQNAKTAYSTLGNNIVGAAQRISSATMAFSAFKGAWDALNNEDMGFFEKFLSVTMSLSMGISGLGMAFQGLSIAKIKDGALSLKNAIIYGIETLALKGVEEAQEEVNEEKEKEAILNATDGQEQEIAGNITEAKSLNGVAAAAERANKAKEKGQLAGVGTGLEKAKNVGKGLLGIVSKIPGPILAAAAAAVGLIIVFKAIKANSPEGQLESLQNKADAAAENFSKISGELQNTIDKKEGLDSLYNTLNNCAVGSTEWKKALIDVNQQVLELINTYPELAKFLERDSNGVLSIGEEGWDALIDRQTAAANAAMAGQLEAQTAVAKQKVSNDQSTSNFGGIWTTTSSDIEQYKAIADVYAKTPEVLAYDQENTKDRKKALGEIKELTGVKVSAEILENAMGKYSDQLMQLVSDTEEYNSLLIQSTKAQQDLFKNAIEDRIGKENQGNVEEVAGILSRKSQDVVDSNVATLEDTGKSDVKDIYSDLILGRKMTEDEEKDFNEQWKDDDQKDALLNTIATQMATIDQNELNRIIGEGFTGLSNDTITAANEIVNSINNNKNLTEAGKNVANQFIADGTLSGISQADYMSLDLDADGGIDKKEVAGYVNTAFGGKDGELSNEEAEKLGYDSAEAFMQAFSDAVSKGWDKKAFEEKEEEQTNLEVDSDVKQDDLKKLTEYYEDYADTIEDVSDELKDNYKASEKVSHSILRFDDAIKDITENGEDWRKTLKKISKSGGVVDAEDVENLEEMRDAYGDLLDIDGESLSDDFIKNADNLDLMEQAANGSEEAYNKLQQAVQKDILAHCDIDTTKFDAAKARLDAALDKKNFDDIEIGANLKGDGALNAMSDLVNAANMTAQQATDYLASMGIDAEVVEDKKTKTETVAYNTEPVVDTVEVPYSPAVVGGKPGKETATYPSVKFKKTPVKAQKETGGTALRVKSARKSSGGNFKYTSSGGGGSRGGGGGGGGGGRSSAPARRSVAKKSTSNEKERYFTVTNQLEDLEHQLDKIEKAKDRAFGVSKIKAIDNETKALNNLLEKQKEYQAEIQKYLKQDKNKLLNMNIGVKFDANGTITNYDKIMNDAVAKFNARINSYNAQSGSTQEAWDKQYENRLDSETGEVYGSYEGWAEAEFKKVKEAIDQYTETQDLAKDVETEIQDTLNQIYDLKLEKVEYTVELKVDVAEDSLELIDFLMERIEDDAFQAAEQVVKLGETIDASMDKIAAHRQGLVDLFNNHDLNGSVLVDMLESGNVAGFEKATNGINLTEAEIEFIREAKSEMLDNLSEIRDAQIEVIELVGEVFDAHMEEFDKIIERTEHLQDITNSYKEIVDVVGRKAADVSTETMKMLNATATDLAIDQIGRSKAKYDEATREYKEALEERQIAMDAGDAELIKHWNEVCDDIQEGMQDAQSEFMDSWIAALEQARQEFSDNMAAIIEDFKTQMGGLAGSLDALENQFDLQSQMTNTYLPDYERVYELNKLIRDISNSIDETPNVKAKRELLELEEEINKAREEGKPLSEYDLNYLRKRYELKVAELSLKEAQDAKSQVRMTKDSEGNFGYVYTADDEMVETAEQNYEDKLFEMQQMNAEYINNLQQSLLDLNNEYASQFEQLGELYEIGSEEYVAALDQLQSWYANQQLFYTSQLDGVMTNNEVLYEVEVTKYAEMTNNKAMLDLEYISQFSQLPLAILTGYTTMEEYQSAWQQEAALMYDEAAANAETYKERQNEAMNEAGTAMEELSDTIQTEVEEINDQNNQLTEDMNETLQDVQDNWDKTIDKVKLFETQYTETVNKLVKLNTTLVDSMNKMLAAWSGVKEAEIRQNAPRSSSSGGGRGSGGGGGGGGGRPNLRPGGIIGYNGKYHADSYGGGASGSWYSGRRNAVKVSRYSLSPYGSQRYGGSYKVHIETLRGGPLGWIKPSQAFDTGGYTGKWGNKEGRLAMLHQKEIVLNEGDTKNFLKTVELVRQISQTIDLNALSSAGALGGGLRSTAIRNTNQESLQQNVHITAEFPNATDKQEILNAFDNVINLAAQYANRK